MNEADQAATAGVVATVASTVTHGLLPYKKRFLMKLTWVALSTAAINAIRIASSATGGTGKEVPRLRCEHRWRCWKVRPWLLLLAL